MAKAIVTGAAGFIGSTLSDTLLEQGKDVIGIDCFTDYYERSTKEKNLESSKTHENFSFLELDLAEADLSDAFSGVDVVYHLAAQPGVRYSWENFDVYLKNNIKATQRVLEAAKESGSRVIFSSSSSVYGDAELPLTEDTKARPVSPYGASKLACEHLCRIYSESFKVPTVSLRYFTVYGPRQRPDMAINIFTHKILAGEPIKIYGSGEQTRDFTYVQDIVDGTIAAGESSLSNDILNIGGGSQIMLNDLISKIEKALGKEAKIEKEESQRGDMKHTKASLDRAKKDIGYEPKISIDEGIKRYTDWVVSNG